MYNKSKHIHDVWAKSRMPQTLLGFISICCSNFIIAVQIVRNEIVNIIHDNDPRFIAKLISPRIYNIWQGLVCLFTMNPPFSDRHTDNSECCVKKNIQTKWYSFRQTCINHWIESLFLMYFISSPTSIPDWSYMDFTIQG